MDRPLTNKQVKYVAAVVRGLTGIQACMEAGYKGDEHQLSVVSAQNLGKLRIKEAIDEFRAEIKRECKDKIAQLVEDWQELRLRCKGGVHGDRSTEARCLENISKHYGFFELDNKQKAEQTALDHKEVEQAKMIAMQLTVNSLIVSGDK